MNPYLIVRDNEDRRFKMLGVTDYTVEIIEDRRTESSSIPSHLENVLNDLQMKTLLQLESSGWQLWFVRRPLSQPAIPVLYDPSFSFTAIIEEDGKENTNHGLTFRPDQVH